VAGRAPNYGFKYNETHDGYVVDEEQMRVMKRVFRMLAVEGQPLNAVRRTLEREGITAPTGSKSWVPKTLRGSLVMCIVHTPIRKLCRWSASPWRRD
jgi:hypothetical protein